MSKVKEGFKAKDLIEWYKNPKNWIAVFKWLAIIIPALFVTIMIDIRFSNAIPNHWYVFLSLLTSSGASLFINIGNNQIYKETEKKERLAQEKVTKGELKNEELRWQNKMLIQENDLLKERRVLLKDRAILKEEIRHLREVSQHRISLAAKGIETDEPELLAIEKAESASDNYNEANEGIKAIEDLEKLIEQKDLKIGELETKIVEIESQKK